MLTIKEGDIVSHYKRDKCTAAELEKEPNMYLYEIIGLAYNCTDESGSMIVYRALYGDRPQLLVRTAGDFLSYVFSAGRYRFEKFEDEKDAVKALPNFDPDNFKQCTGITV